MQKAGKNYLNYGGWLKEKFNGEKVFKVIVDAGFSCPNRDGSKGFGGCTYCNVDSFTPSVTRSHETIREQLEQSMERAKRMYKADKFIVYFQPNTNTHAPVETLQQYFDEALLVNPKETVGLSIGTRSDCLDDQKLDLIESYSKHLCVDLEIGMESMYDESLQMLNRGHTHQEFLNVVEKLGDRSFDVCVHTIFGLPGETHDMMLAVADELNRLPIRFVKLHHLYIVKGSVMGVKYRRDPASIPLFTLEAYTDFLCEFLPRLRPDLVIQRLFGISDREFHLAPNWGLSKRSLQVHFDRAFVDRNVVQGSAYQPTTIQTLV
jgi:radical SAM protein (TIGR01212 family)